MKHGCVADVSVVTSSKKTILKLGLINHWGRKICGRSKCFVVELPGGSDMVIQVEAGKWWLSGCHQSSSSVCNFPHSIIFLCYPNPVVDSVERRVEWSGAVPVYCGTR